MKIKYLIGNAVEPVGDGTKIIAHIVNDTGGFGSGFVRALMEKWPKEMGRISPEVRYREWYKNETTFNGKPFVLGQIDTGWVENETFVCNMIAQRDYRPLTEQGVDLQLPNCKLSSLLECLMRLLVQCELAINDGKTVSVHCPRFGAGLGGEKWERVEKVINSVFEQTAIPVYVYDQQPMSGVTY